MRYQRAADRQTAAVRKRKGAVRMQDVPFLKLAVFVSAATLLFVLYLARYVLRQPQGTERMAKISEMVQEGAQAFLRREYSYVVVLALIVMAFLAGIGVYDAELGLNWKTAIAFAAGAIASACAGFLGMYIATRANARTTEAARAKEVVGALDVAISGGAVMGMGVVSIALMGLAFVYWLFEGNSVIVNGYAMGASLVALFGRSGGGIFTKGADMGADLVGKVEAGIPEDDPRNPAVIADNVGDNVGDVAGLGADLLESYVESIIASLAIAAIIVAAGGPMYVLAFPFVVAAMGMVASIIGVLYVKKFAQSNPQKALMMGTYISALLTIIGAFAYARLAGSDFVIDGAAYAWWGPFAACVLGIVSGSIVGFVRYYFLGPDRLRRSRGAWTGPAIAVVEGMAVGMQSTGIPVIVLALAVVVPTTAAACTAWRLRRWHADHGYGGGCGRVWPHRGQRGRDRRSQP